MQIMRMLSWLKSRRENGHWIDTEFPSFSEMQGRLGVGINRRRVTSITPPALTRNLVLWLPRVKAELKKADTARLKDRSDLSESLQKIDESRKTQDTRDSSIEVFDQLISTVYTALKTKTTLFFNVVSNAENRQGIVDLFSSCIDADTGEVLEDEPNSPAHRSVNLSCIYDGLQLQIGFDLHEEIATITYQIELSQAAEHHPSLTETCRLVRVFGALCSGSASDLPNVREDGRFLYAGIWDSLDRSLLVQAAQKSGEDVEPEKFYKKAGRRILDVRGVLLGVRTDRPVSPPSPTQ